MKFIIFFLFISAKHLFVENSMLPVLVSPSLESIMESDAEESFDNMKGKVIGLKSDENKEDDYGFIEKTPHFNERIKKPCSVIVLSNSQNPNVQSLLRRYRYDANGILIPNSVRYFIKLPQGKSLAPILVPLNDKAFTPLGGFVRYYKEVPPIPQSW